MVDAALRGGKDSRVDVHGSSYVETLQFERDYRVALVKTIVSLDKKVDRGRFDIHETKSIPISGKRLNKNLFFKYITHTI